MASISRTFRDMKRLSQIAEVLFKNELGFILERIRLRNLLPYRKRLKGEKFEQTGNSYPERIKKSMEDLGGGFIKLGQLLSLRPDIIPKEYCDEFSKLLDHVKPFSFNQVREIIESELKKPINSLFKTFGKEPIASASVSQVHSAVLFSGEKVAVKVQRPNIDKVFDVDIDLIYHLALLLEKHFPELKTYNIIGIVEEFETYTKKELDFIHESGNIKAFYENFRNKDGVVIPKVFDNLTTRKVLTMQFIPGHKVDDISYFRKLNSTRKKVVENVVNSFLEQVVDFGTFHADPHPGNVFLLSNNRIAFLDFGIVGRINTEIESNVENILVSLIKPDVDLLAHSLLDIGMVTSDINIENFKLDLSRSLSHYYNKKLEDLKLSEVFNDVFNLVRKYKIILPPNFVLLGKAIITTEAFCKKVYPEFNFVQAAKPKVRKIIRKKTSFDHMTNSIKKSFLDFSYFAKSFPNDVRELIRSWKFKDRIKIDLEDSDINKFALELDRSSNRVSFSLIIAALVLAGALIIMAQMPPFIFNIPVLAAICFLIAFIFLFMLFISILREKKGGV